MAETLPPIPMAFSPTITEEPRVRRVKFGDGYESRVPDGLNTNAMKITIPWKNRSHAEIDVLLSFFRRHGGHRYFLWRPHGQNETHKFICPKWTYSRSQNSNPFAARFDMDAEFYQIFDLV